MERREYNRKAAESHHKDDEEDCGDAPKLSNFVFEPDSGDDQEINEDSSLKNVEKTMSRPLATSSGAASAALNGGDGLLPKTQDSDDMNDKKKLKAVNKIKKKKKTETPEEIVHVTRKEGNDTVNDVEITKLVETSHVETSDNVILKKLLRGPRYFDLQGGGWVMCYNCGEEGHKTANCTSERRAKPCFVCGSLKHKANQCLKGRDCFICKKGGHLSKECPEKYKGKFHESSMCLKCGGSGHDMFSCKNSYFADDLKEIPCYFCKSSGHICCANIVDPGPNVVSCYRCGEIGHDGLDCGRSLGESNAVVSCYKCGKGHFARDCRSSSTKERGKSRGESTIAGSCYKCGEEGHFARECRSSSTKTRKRNHESATPTKKIRKVNKDPKGNKSMPPNFGKPRRKKSQLDEGFSIPPVSKKKGGWIPEDYEDFPRRNKQRSPATPTMFRNNYYGSVPHSYSPVYTPRFGSTASNRSARFDQQQYSASRFGNSSSNNWERRDYGW
ncbi:protein AIR1-like isoform X2 [Impatiens glandulifera]|uniref:protein AIR1-like isoform X2 n=1 Tax=Impatiens glandulifera TaxID=253017 RepID=UPI001FB16FDF|nr:protein AIR1-like isoform X2 [Impatiens glandulifera]